MSKKTRPPTSDPSRTIVRPALKDGKSKEQGVVRRLPKAKAQPQKVQPASEATLPDKLALERPPDISHAQAEADLAVDGVAPAACLVRRFSVMKVAPGITETFTALEEAIRLVKAGDMSGQEALLTAQSVALHAMFTKLSDVASTQDLKQAMARLTMSKAVSQDRSA